MTQIRSTMMAPFPLPSRLSIGAALMSVLVSACCDTMPQHNDGHKAGTTDVKWTVNGETLAFSHAILVLEGSAGARLVLGPATLSCGNEKESGEADQKVFPRVDVEIRIGPGRKYFAGAPVPARANGLRTAHISDGSFTTQSNEVMLSLDAGGMKPGGRARGRVDVHGLGAHPQSGGGTFDALVCQARVNYGDWEKDLRAQLPATAPAGPVSGTVVKKPFVAKSVSVWVDSDEATRQIKFISRLCVMSTPNAGCACPEFDGTTGHPEGFSISAEEMTDRGGVGLPGTLSSHPMTGVLLPLTSTMRFFRRGDEAPNLMLGGNGWIRWDALAFTPGATVKAALAIADFDGGHSFPPEANVAGHIEAVLCDARAGAPATRATPSHSGGHRPGRP